jgi:hypothetical protein
VEPRNVSKRPAPGGSLPRLTTRRTKCQDGVDALGWTVGAVYSCHGARVGLRSTEASGLDALVSWLPRALAPVRAKSVPVLYSFLVGGQAPNSRTKTFHILYKNFQRLARSLDIEEIRRAFERDLGVSVGEHADKRVFVHAGVVGFKKGAIVVPGKSFTGKTTLIQALVAQGGVYYSDEYAVLDSRGRVSPWAEPLSIRMDGARKPAESHSAASLGLAVGKGALPVRLVVLTSFQEGKRFRPRKVTPAGGTLGMLEHTLPARRHPRTSLQYLASAVKDARVIQGTRGEAGEAARAIVRILDSPRTA